MQPQGEPSCGVTPVLLEPGHAHLLTEWPSCNTETWLSDLKILTRAPCREMWPAPVWRTCYASFHLIYHIPRRGRCNYPHLAGAETEVREVKTVTPDGKANSTGDPQNHDWWRCFLCRDDKFGRSNPVTSEVQANDENQPW